MPLPGRASPPMANGEVIFDEPWQGRVFGMARVLCEQGRFDWDEFREKLIADIDGAGPGDYRYFDHFLNALLSLLEEKQVCARAELQARVGDYALRPHGHDH